MKKIIIGGDDTGAIAIILMQVDLKFLHTQILQMTCQNLFIKVLFVMIL